jgi:hypothetical protein
MSFRRIRILVSRKTQGCKLLFLDNNRSVFMLWHEPCLGKSWKAKQRE